MQIFQRAAAAAFSLSVAALIVFWTVKGTKPSGSAVLPILYGLLIASALIWLLAETLRRRGKHHKPRVSLDIGGAVFGERNHHTVVQLTVTVRNDGTPTTVHQWRLDVEASGRTYNTRHVIGEAPFYRSLDVPMLDKAISYTALGTGEITGLLQFVVPGVSQQQLLDAFDHTDQPARLILAARCGTKGGCQTESDVHALKVSRHEVVPSAPVAQPESHPDSPERGSGRVGYRGHPGSFGDLSKATFGKGLDTAIENEGEVDASEADFK